MQKQVFQEASDKKRNLFMPKKREFLVPKGNSFSEAITTSTVSAG